MKKIKRFSALLMSFLMILTSSQIILAWSDDDDGVNYAAIAEFGAELNAIFGEEFIRNYTDAAKIFEGLLDLFPRDRTGNIMYPEGFAGFMLDESGHLVIMVTSSDYLSTLRNMPLDNVIIRFVDYSYGELSRLSKIIWDIVDERWEAGCRYAMNVTGGGISHVYNRYIIRLEVLNDEMIEGFRRYILDSQMLSFEQGDFLRWGPPNSSFHTICYDNCFGLGFSCFDCTCHCVDGYNLSWCCEGACCQESKEITAHNGSY